MHAPASVRLMRTDGEPLAIDGVTWRVSRVSPGLLAKGSEEFRGIEFQNGNTVRRLELKSIDLPSAEEFAQLHRSVVAGMFKRSRE